MPILSVRLLTKFAVTVVLDDKVILQSAIPVHPPVQPRNVKPALGIACKVMDVPVTKLKEQLVPQLMPEGVLATAPLPILETERLAVLGVKVAVQVLFAFIVTEPSAQSACPVHALNLEFAAGIGVKVTIRPAG